jgi:hypothetical protein
MNTNPTHINNTPAFHTHTFLPLELKAVGGAIRLGRGNNGCLHANRQNMIEQLTVEPLVNSD